MLGCWACPLSSPSRDSSEATTRIGHHDESVRSLLRGPTTLTHRIERGAFLAHALPGLDIARAPQRRDGWIGVARRVGRAGCDLASRNRAGGRCIRGRCVGLCGCRIIGCRRRLEGCVTFLFGGLRRLLGAATREQEAADDTRNEDAHAQSLQRGDGTRAQHGHSPANAPSGRVHHHARSVTARAST